MDFVYDYEVTKQHTLQSTIGLLLVVNDTDEFGPAVRVRNLTFNHFKNKKDYCI